MLYYQQRNIVYKNCSKCEQFFPVDSFYPDRRAVDGTKSRCVVCLTEDTQKFRRTHLKLYQKATKRWRRKHYEDALKRGRANTAKRRLFASKSKSHYTSEDITQLLHNLSWCCFWCKQPVVQYHIDHIVPLSRGGSNAASNITIACPQCNLRKRNKLPNEWLAYLNKS